MISSRVSLACVVCLAHLAAAKAAVCENTFANLTVCVAFNGVISARVDEGAMHRLSRAMHRLSRVAADGDTSLVRAKNLELEVTNAYTADLAITKNDRCKALFLTNHCVLRSTTSTLWTKDSRTYQYSAPCAADGTRLTRPCFEWCHEFQRLCYFEEMESQHAETCSSQAAAQGDNTCWGDAGSNSPKFMYLCSVLCLIL
jgi:hypothetical protein